MTAGRNKPPQDWHFGKSLTGMLADPALGSGFPLFRNASQMGLKNQYYNKVVQFQIPIAINMHLS